MRRSRSRRPAGRPDQGRREQEKQEEEGGSCTWVEGGGSLARAAAANPSLRFLPSWEARFLSVVREGEAAHSFLVKRRRTGIHLLVASGVNTSQF